MEIEQKFYEEFGIAPVNYVAPPQDEYCGDREVYLDSSYPIYPPITQEILSKLEEIILKRYIMVKYLNSTDYGYEYEVCVCEYDSPDYFAKYSASGTNKDCILSICIQTREELQGGVGELFW